MKCDAIIFGDPVAWPGGGSFLLQEAGPKRVIEHWSDTLMEGNHHLTLWMDTPDEDLIEFVSSRFPLSKRVTLRVGLPSKAEQACSYFNEDGTIAVTTGETLRPYLADANPTAVWYSLVRRWIEELVSKGSPVPELEHEIIPGALIGHHCKISPDTKFISPCWVGSHTTLQACTVGPFAVIGSNCIVSKGTQITESAVAGNTYVGKNLSLDGLAAKGGRIIQHASGQCAEILDPTMLTDVRS